ncbi:Gpaa1 [Scenedesmus sp. PABB004]|nr:Gpaa1 [Scenedesmus sp. PABB004]
MPPPPVGAGGGRSLTAALEAVARRAAPLSALLVAIGLAGLLALPLLARPITFDENALLAGSARPTLRAKSPAAYAAGKAFAAGLAPDLFGPRFTASLQAALAAQLGLPVHNHTFAAARPAAGGAPRACTNVHAVLSSPRGDGKEALLLVTPINHQAFATDFEQDASGAGLALALGFALLAHLDSAAPWLAKEVVWVLPDASCGLVAAMAAWAEAYQNPALGAPGLEAFGRGGVLQQGLVLELPTGTPNTLQASLEGWDGLLPKLDTYWLLRWYCSHYVAAPLELAQDAGLQRALGAGADAASAALARAGATGAASAAAAAGVLTRFMVRQARGLPTGGHAALKALGVDAATLRALAKDGAGRVLGPAGFAGADNAAPRPGAPHPRGGGPPARRRLSADEALAQLGDVAELVLRSCSCLIERFHHSLFLYALTGLEAYVSVERYVAPLAALILVLPLQARPGRQGGEGDGGRAGGRALRARECRPARLAPGCAAQAAALRSTPAPPRASGSAGAGGAGGVGGARRRLAAKLAGLAARLGHRPAPGGGGDGAAAASGAPPAPPAPLAPVDLLQLAPAGETAAALVQWGGALKLVMAVHALAVAAGCALRRAPELLPVLRLPGLAAWLARAAAAPADHAAELGAGCGLVLALWAVLDGLASACAAGACGGAGAADGCSSSTSSRSSRSGSRAAFVRRVLVAELSAAAAALAALACLNWALAYAACLVVVPLALGCTPPPAEPSGAGGAAGARRRGRRRAAAVLACCSPPAVAAALGVASGSGVGPAWLAWLALRSSWGAWLVAWGVVLPFWGVAAWAVADGSAW